MNSALRAVALVALVAGSLAITHHADAVNNSCNNEFGSTQYAGTLPGGISYATSTTGNVKLFVGSTQFQTGNGEAWIDTGVFGAGFDHNSNASPFGPIPAGCVSGITGNSDVRVDVIDKYPSSPGYVVRVRKCTPLTTTCSTAVGITGIEVNQAAPLNSCVWVNGVQQWPSHPCP